MFKNTRKIKNKKNKKINCGEILINVIRNDIIESIHSGHLLILDNLGKTKFSLGNNDFLMYPRSAIKAIQTSAMVRHGLNINDELLALVSSSHTGTKIHQQKVKEILSTVGLNESVLKNTPFVAMSKNIGGIPTSLAAPCSGKHAGMIAISKINNWSITNYKNQDHPMQLECKQELELLSKEKITKIAVDGCGAPAFAITLKGLANAIHHLMISKDPVHQRVVNACKSYPMMVSGKNTLPTLAMETIDGLFVKTGAESVMVAGLPSGQTIVWKVSDGSSRGEFELLIASLRKIGISNTLFNSYANNDSIKSSF
jgi:L-asparaginase II